MDLRSVAGRMRERAGPALARRFGVDPRALAAMRVSVGLVVLADLALRSRHLSAFYTDAGVLPRSLLRELYPGFSVLSVHALSGAWWVQAALFVAAGAAAVALALGYRTTLATVVSFALLVSLHARNPLVLNAGDSVLRRLLLWGGFLPLGARWSVDALRRGDAVGHGDGPEQQNADLVATVASAALLVQVAIVYAANGLFKLRGDSWLSGEAMRYALGLDQLTTPLGAALTGFPALLGVLDLLWVGLLLASPLLLALTGWPRAALAGLFVGMHLGMAATLYLGVFPFASAAGLLAFLPPKFWDVAERAWATYAPRWLGIGPVLRRVDRALPGATGSAVPGIAVSGVGLPEVGVPGIDTVRTLARRTRRAASAARPPVVGCLLALVLVWNAATLGAVAMPEEVSETVDPEEYRWDMFAPEPRTDDGWYVVPGRLASGETLDAYRGGPVEWDRPPNVAATYPGVRWYKYLVDLQRTRNPAVGAGYADYLCREWNRTHEVGLERVTVYYVEERVRLDAPESAERERLFAYSCTRGELIGE